ncbi:hypothetical protein [endosymbiont GvMRE of Glomus versiforme]|uniref:hypothetical protein n=1 Tax=endosymbiont GvMRE of Glomus versiforme TaxID=2039283 RepID=UPI000ED6F4E6|nr:hypothetical protein [endosymbiont GvMRE of Glomus versiforme]RHZ35537.1 hypothetical protein GvMRE_IIg194 [endosymbiont GvMRE of Glomus versiforme]
MNCSVALKIILWIIGIIIVIFSFFFEEEDNFSPTQEAKENIYKTTHFTKLTNFIRNIYILLIGIFILLVFLLPGI